MCYRCMCSRCDTDQGVVVVHLDDDAWRFLLDVLQVSRQKQSIHHHTLVPGRTQGLVDDLTDRRRETGGRQVRQEDRGTGRQMRQVDR